MKKNRPWYERPQPVINRYVRMRLHRTCYPIIKNLVRRYMRVKLYFPERKRRRALDDALASTVKNFEDVQRSQFESVKILFNIQLFFLIAETDLQTVKLDALTHPNLWKRNLALRVALLTIHELDLGKVASASHLNRAFDDAGIEGDLRQQMTEAMRKINKAQTRAKNALSELRHSTIAHRNADALYQYKMITETDSQKVFEAIAEFYEGADLFTKVLPKALLASSRAPELLKQMENKA